MGSLNSTQNQTISKNGFREDTTSSKNQISIEGERLRQREDLPVGENGVVFSPLVIFSFEHSGDDGERNAVAEIHSDQISDKNVKAFFITFEFFFFCAH